jgi:hypothetical protein
VSRRLRFRFSLATLLITMAWSAVVVWINVTPRFALERLSVVGRHGHDQIGVYLIRWGWPFPYANSFVFWPVPLSDFPPGGIEAYWAFAGDVAVGVLLVAALTWGSNQLLRRVGTKLWRRKAAEELP